MEARQDMDNTIALVTGAAGGIGSAVVQALAERGASVAAVDRDAEALDRVAGELTAKGLHVTPYPTDITRADDVERTVAAVESGLGPVDHLVNGAGVLRLGGAVELSDEDWDTTFAVNTGGVFHVSRAVVRRMKERRRGNVVTIASNAAGTPPYRDGRLRRLQGRRRDVHQEPRAGGGPARHPLQRRRPRPPGGPGPPGG
ncbi:hypothetical protein CVT27_08270 [Streptomyces cavourensis]|nr:hypothetical protein CVT27_08270 [Streptomyces cavourensis]